MGDYWSQLKESLLSLRTHLVRLVTSPAEELTRAQRSLRFAIMLGRHGARVLRENNANQMAAALTYRTIFSLIPIVVLALIMFRVLGGLEGLQPEIQERLSDYLGLKALSLHPAAGADASTTDALSDSASRELSLALKHIIDNLATKAQAIHIQSVGIVGLLVFFWGATGLLSEIEMCFNQIYNSQRGRSLVQRVARYWTVITLGPVLLLLSLDLADQAAAWFGNGSGNGDAWLSYAWLAQFAASWLLFFLLYRWMPNTSVRARPSLIGSAIAAMLWELGKWGFKLYVTRTLPYSAIYGSLALVPLFLVWVHLTWLVVLFGLQIAYTLQALVDGASDDLEKLADRHRIDDPRWIIPILAKSAQAFRKAGTVTVSSLARELDLPVAVVAKLVDKLCESQHLHAVQHDPRLAASYTIARPPEQLALIDLLLLIQQLTLGDREHTGQPGWDFIWQLNAAQHNTAGRRTLADLLPELPAQDSEPAAQSAASAKLDPSGTSE